MEAEEVIDVLEYINEALIKSPMPAQVKRRIPSVLEGLAQYVNAVGPDAHAAYIAAKERLTNPRTNLINPRTGEVIRE